jgi:hypothetical protein
VARDRVLAEAQTLADVRVRESGPGEMQNLDLPFAETGPLATLRHKTSALAKVVVTPGEAREELVGASGAERFDGRTARRQWRRSVINVPHGVDTAMS